VLEYVTDQHLLVTHLALVDRSRIADSIRRPILTPPSQRA
jgi:hypothetical protein